MKKELVLMIAELLKGTKAEQQLAEVMLERIVLKEDKTSGGLGMPKEKKVGGLEEVETKKIVGLLDMLTQEEIDDLDGVKTKGGLGMPKENRYRNDKYKRLDEELVRNYRRLRQVEDMIAETMCEHENLDLFEEMYELEFQIDTIEKAKDLEIDILMIKDILEDERDIREIERLYMSLEKKELEQETLEAMITSVASNRR